MNSGDKKVNAREGQSVPAGIEIVFMAVFYKDYFNGDFFDTIMDTIKR
ncbi:MAG: hypothetical protein E6563_13610 [Enterobacter sp.]|nr:MULTISPECIES: hypothetical protein [Enterobacter]EKY3988681.1 hypothetical protein [Enterobacter roggenkampii]MDU6421531.1 hypothetical protein [Enterobacter sp.]